MKTFIAIIIAFLSSSSSFSQIDFDNPPWETGCDSLTSQVEMNFCSYEKFKIADSVLNCYYDRMIDDLESQYQSAIQEKKKSKDTSQKEYLQHLKSEKAALVKSRTIFKELRDNLMSIVSDEYWGGTIRPLMVNLVAFELTVNQIKILAGMMQEI